jgi:hypothetical protein
MPQQTAALRCSQKPPFILFVFGAIAFSLLAWFPSMVMVANGSGDGLFDLVLFGKTCRPMGLEMGWPYNSQQLGVSVGAWAPAATLYVVQSAACEISLLTRLPVLSVFIILGVSLTILLGFWACRYIGCGRFSSLAAATAMATAPCAFSRIAHIMLSQLWPVLPATACACLILVGGRRGNEIARPAGSLQDGSLLGLMAFTGQEYYAVFGTLVVLCCWLVRVLDWLVLTGRHRPGLRLQIARLSNVSSVAAGFTIIQVIILGSKQLLWHIPSSALHAAQRYPAEQFLYGFWPFTLLTSPLINDRLIERINSAFIPLREAFLSSGSLMVPIGLALAYKIIKDYRMQPQSHTGPIIESGMQAMVKSGNNRLMPASSCVLLISVSLALVVMTSGGLGTLFALYGSPQLRALNRFLPYVYAPAVLTIALWMEVQTRRMFKSAES